MHLISCERETFLVRNISLENYLTLMYSSTWFYFIQCLISSSFIDHHCLPYVPFLIQFHQTLTKLSQFILQPTKIFVFVDFNINQGSSWCNSSSTPPPLQPPPPPHTHTHTHKHTHTQHTFMKGGTDPLKFDIIREIDNVCLKLGIDLKPLRS